MGGIKTLPFENYSLMTGGLAVLVYEYYVHGYLCVYHYFVCRRSLVQ